MPDTAPEWVENQSKPTNGLDLTGLRLPVDAISTYQLIGITTVTPRIRFLSIRAWIIKTFGESGLPNSQDSFREFAFRVETAIILATLLVNRQLLYLPGVTRALDVIVEGGDSIDLTPLVDQPGFTLYAGTSYNLLLGFSQDNGSPGLTQERGLPLALTFEDLIKNTRFFNILKENPNIANIPRDVLAELGQAINLEEISDTESSCLLSALMPSHPAEQWAPRELRRVGAYSLFLELAKQHQRKPVEDDIFNAALADETPLPGHLTSVLDGYLCYRVRDSLAVVHEAVLGLVCNELGGFEGAVHHDEIIHNLVSSESCNEALSTLGLLAEEETIFTIHFRTLAERVTALLHNKRAARGLYRWQGNLDENVLIEKTLKNRALAAGILPVVWLLCQNRVANDDPEAFPHMRILLQAGLARFGFREVLIPQLELWNAENPILADIISWLIQRTVDQHLRIAWSRMFADMNKDVAILLCDGELWQHRSRAYEGGRMASRISDAIGWLGQLELLNEDGLTPKGQEALDHGYEVLVRCGSEK